MEVGNNRSLGGIRHRSLTRKGQPQGVRGEAMNLIDAPELWGTISASLSRN